MGGRAYLYTFNEGNEPIKPISNCDWEIPLSYKILVSVNSGLITQEFFSENSAYSIEGNAENGRKLLLDLLKVLFDSEISNKDKFEKKVAETIEFLEKAENKKEFYLLCPYEILEQSSAINIEIDNNSSIFEIAKDLFSGVKNTQRTIEENLNFEKGKFFELTSSLILKDLQNNWEENLGLFWTNYID